MTNLPIIADSPQPSASETPHDQRKTVSLRSGITVLTELFRTVGVLLTVGLVVILFSSGVAQLYLDIDAATGGDTEGLLPSVDALQASWDENSELIMERHVPATLWATATGLSIAIALGIFLAAIMDLFAPLRWVLYPVIVVSQTIPIFAIAVLLIILFGFNFGPKIIVVMLFCFFPITINTLSGLQSTNPVHSSLLRAMGANRVQIWWKVRLPSAMPSFFSGLRIAATYSVVGAVIGEYVGSGDGLGRFLQRSYRSFDTDQTYLAIAVISAISVMFVIFTMLVEMLILRWRYAGMVNTGRYLRSITAFFIKHINTKHSATGENSRDKSS